MKDFEIQEFISNYIKFFKCRHKFWQKVRPENRKDAKQDLFLLLYSKKDQYQPSKAAFSTWTFYWCLHLAKEYARKQRQFSSKRMSHSFYYDQSLERIDTFDSLRVAVDRLGPETVETAQLISKNTPIDIMKDIVYCKFTQHPDLAKKLIETEDHHLIEGNNWNDKFWGVCQGRGQNHLGRLLMDLRELLKEQSISRSVV